MTVAEKEPGADLYVEEVEPEHHHIAPGGEMYLDVVHKKDESKAVCTLVVTLDGFEIWRDGQMVEQAASLRAVYTKVEKEGWAK